MEITIHAFCKKTDSDYIAAIEEYSKRTSPFCRLTMKWYKKIKAPQLNKSSKCFKLIPGKETVSSEDFCKMINDICLQGYSSIEFIISNGLETDITDEFMLSSFSMDNQLTAVALTEQIYRAFTILNNITYHK